MQAILTYIVIALAVGYAVWRLIRRIRGRGGSCSCGGNNGEGKCPECHTACNNCPLCDNCKMKGT
jgi:hypothetical protein